MNFMYSRYVMGEEGKGIWMDGLKEIWEGELSEETETHTETE